MTKENVTGTGRWEEMCQRRKAKTSQVPFRGTASLCPCMCRLWLPFFFFKQAEAMGGNMTYQN